MGNILIRNLDDGVIAAWKQRADANGRSLQAELHAELSSAVDVQRKRNVIEKLRAIASRADASKLGSESWELVREDRDRR